MPSVGLQSAVQTRPTRWNLECYRRAQARVDGVAFMQWLKRGGWRIVICTQRDLRTS
jgi:hypothetical protein